MVYVLAFFWLGSRVKDAIIIFDWCLKQMCLRRGKEWNTNFLCLNLSTVVNTRTLGAGCTVQCFVVLNAGGITVHFKYLTSDICFVHMIKRVWWKYMLESATDFVIFLQNPNALWEFVNVLFSVETVFVCSKLPCKRQVCRGVLHQLKCECLLGKKFR